MELFFSWKGAFDLRRQCSCFTCVLLCSSNVRSRCFISVISDLSLNDETFSPYLKPTDLKIYIVATKQLHSSNGVTLELRVLQSIVLFDGYLGSLQELWSECTEFMQVMQVHTFRCYEWCS